MTGQVPVRRPRCLHCGSQDRPLIVIGSVDGVPVFACAPACPPKDDNR